MPHLQGKCDIIISNLWHIYSFIACLVSVQPVCVCHCFSSFHWNISLVPVKTWPGETCSIWLCALHTRTTLSPMTGEPMESAAKVPYLSSSLPFEVFKHWRSAANKHTSTECPEITVVVWISLHSYSLVCEDEALRMDMLYHFSLSLQLAIHMDMVF